MPLRRDLRDAGGEVLRVGVLAAGVDDQQQAVAVVGDHQVIQDAAGLVQEQAVALPARLDAQHVARHQRLQRRRGIGAVQADLAHVRHVEQRRTLPALHVLRHDAGGELHRQLIAGKGHHAAAQPAMQRVQRRGAQDVGIRILEVARDEFGQACTLRAERPPAGDIACRNDPPLSRDLRDSGAACTPLLRRCGPERWAGFPETLAPCGPLCLSVSGGRLRLRRRTSPLSPARVVRADAP